MAKTYELGVAYSTTTGYWWEITYSNPACGGDGKYYVLQNGLTDNALAA